MCLLYIFHMIYTRKQYRNHMAVKKANLNDLISEGAPVISDGEKSKAKRIPINIGIPEQMLVDIDRLIDRESTGISRTAWILDAMREKLSVGIR